MLVCTCVALIVGGWIAHAFPSTALTQSALYLGLLQGALGIVIIPTLTSIWRAIWGPLYQAEQNLTAKVVQMFQSDRQVRFSSAWLFLFALLSLVLAIDAWTLQLSLHPYVLAGWMILLGYSLDTVRHLLRHMMLYLSPFAVVDMFSKLAHLSVQEEREVDLCEWIDAIAEIANKSIDQMSLSLSKHAITHLQKIVGHFLLSSKSLSHHSEDKQTKAYGIKDKVSFTLFYLFERLELINNQAQEKKLDPICSHLINVMGKIIIDAAKYDVTLAGYPTHYLGKFALQSQKRGAVEIGERATCTLIEVSRALTQEIDLTYMEIKELFVGVVTHMDQIAKEVFRQDKEANLQLLVEPFRQLAKLFEAEKMQGHQDTPAIQRAIQNVVEEFRTLETVLKTMPPLSSLVKESEEVDPSS